MSGMAFRPGLAALAWPASLRRLGPAGLLGLMWVVVPGLLGLCMVAKLGTIAGVLAQGWPAIVLIWTGLMALCIGLGLLPVYSNTLLCGWVFGWKVGSVSATLSYLCAALLGYYLAHSLSHARVNAIIEQHASAQRVRHALVYQDKRRSLLLVLLWRLSGSPFPLTNLVMASCGVPLGTYLLGTLLGLGPRVVIGTLIAATAAQTGARDIQSLVRDNQSPTLLAMGIAASLLGLGLIGQLGRSALRRAMDGSR